MKTGLQILAVAASLGLILGITYLCLPDNQPRPENKATALAARIDQTWGEIEDLRADMHELEMRCSKAREEAYRAGLGLIKQAGEELEKIPEGQGGPEIPQALLKDKKSSKQRR